MISSRNLKLSNNFNFFCHGIKLVSSNSACPVEHSSIDETYIIETYLFRRNSHREIGDDQRT